MRYLEFKKRVEKLPIISSSQLFFLDKDMQILRNQLNRWEKQKLIIKLKKGLYILNESDRKIEPSRMFIANQLYFPSYLSTEYALGFYDLIPERVADVTSVSPRKTYRVKNVFGVFIYQHISSKAFRGFLLLKDENDYSFLIASPEKAIVDFIYLNLSRLKKDDKDIFEYSFRFQNVKRLSQSKLREYARIFGNKKLISVIENFCKFIKKQ